MRHPLVIKAAAAFVAVWLASGCADDSAAPGDGADLEDPTGFFSSEELDEIAQLSPADIPAPDDPTNAVADDPEAARLGQFLFFDRRLSGDGEHSCASCHVPDHGFADPARLSEAVGTTRRHTPSLLNVAYNRWYFWDGRADTLWAQAIQPLEAPHEMATTRLDVIHLVAGDSQLRAAYEEVFGELVDVSDTDRFPESARPVPGQPDHPHHQAWTAMSDADREAINVALTNLTKAIAAYQMRLVSLDSPFDRYVEGLRDGDADKLDALTDSQRRGLALFIGEAGCTNCHSGAMMTNLEFHNLGFEPRGWLEPEDQGRYGGVEAVINDPFNAAGPYSDAPGSAKAKELAFLAQNLEESRGQFKTPTLRNVELSPPYMHGGHFETLEEVMRFYSQLDEAPVLVGHRDETLEVLKLDDAQIDDLVAFMKALTGQPLPAALTEQPNSPMLDE
jgi:cytochrome c peroxidase